MVARVDIKDGQMKEVKEKRHGLTEKRHGLLVYG